MVERDDAELSVSDQADLLSISRSSIYYQPVLPSQEEVKIKNLIDEIYTAKPFYGSRRIGVELERHGVTIARKTVQRFMRENKHTTLPSALTAAVERSTTSSPSACGGVLKYEEVFLNEYASPREAQAGISRYINFYNAERPHQSLAYSGTRRTLRRIAYEKS